MHSRDRAQRYHTQTIGHHLCYFVRIEAWNRHAATFLCVCIKAFQCFCCRYEIWGSVPSVWLLRAHRGCAARLWSRFVVARFLSPRDLGVCGFSSRVCARLWHRVVQTRAVTCCYLFFIPKMKRQVADVFIILDPQMGRRPTSVPVPMQTSTS